MHLGRGYRCGRWYFAWRQLKTCFAVKVDYSCLSLLALLDLLHWVGTSKRFEWDFLFYLPETNKKKALWEWCYLLLPGQFVHSLAG